jgi:hypothetical protein
LQRIDLQAFTRGVAMSALARRWMISVATAVLVAPSLGMGIAESQAPRTPPQRAPQRQPAPPRPPMPRVVVRGDVFIGGYFYDPAFGPYPWWPRGHYRYWYVPVYDVRAVLRLKVTPDDAAVYVDGFYAGVVDDFDGVFQGLPLTPGAHRVRIYRPGYRSERQNIYLGVGSTFTVRAALEPIAPGQCSELPPAAERVPPPPRPGSFRVPVVRWPSGTAAASRDGRAAQAPTGWLDVRVRPSGAAVTIDDEHWLTSDPERVVADLPAGTHRLTVVAPGYVSVHFEVEIVDGDHQAITVSLIPET